MPVTGSSIQQPFGEQVRWLARAALDLLFPPRCVVCRRVGALLCDCCIDAFERVPQPICAVCGEPVRTHSLCMRCKAEPRAFASVRSAFLYSGGVRAAIHALKYKGQQALARPLVKAAAHAFDPPDRTDAIIPVPLHEAREAERGYNQSQLLARDLAECWRVELLQPAALRRVRDTASQVSLDYAKRQANVGGAFAAEPAAVRDRVIILVDDVCTTGATLHSCAQALREAGAIKVYAVTIARAV